MAQGFDYHYGMYSNLDPVETVYFGDKGVPILRNGKVVKRPADPAELTNLYTQEAIQFFKRNKDNPFFLYLPHTMLHVPLGSKPKISRDIRVGESMAMQFRNWTTVLADSWIRSRNLVSMTRRSSCCVRIMDGDQVG